jgi:peptidoglycan/xylan/chitin deacetylase (PgdA/CDA1 family)
MAALNSLLAGDITALRVGEAIAEWREKVFQKFSRFLPSWLIRRVHVPILMYHYISDNPDPKDKVREKLSITPDKFDAQMTYLAQHGYTTISLDTLYDIFNGQVNAPVKSIILTFDDGFVDFYFNAYPILQKYNFYAISFIITGAVGQDRYLSWDQIREIQSSGFISFGAHSVSHPNLTKLSYTRLLSELQDSKSTLEAHIGHTVNFISYPYGRTNSKALSAAKKVGFVGGVGVWYAKASYPSMNMPRVQVSGQMTLRTFASRL